MSALPKIPIVGSIADAGASPPYSPEAEMSVLGGMLIDRDAVARAVAIVDDMMFYREGNRRLFRAMKGLWERGEPIDAVMLLTTLKASGDLEAVGGAQYLAQLQGAVATAANIEYHARIVQGKALQRRLIEVMTGIIGQAYAHQGDPEALCAQATQLIGAVSEGHVSRPGSVMRSLAEILADPEALKLPQPVIPRLAWRERTSLFAAREKLGKSTLAAAGAAAVSDGANFLGESGAEGPVLWVNLEEHEGDTATRFQRFGADPKGLFILSRFNGADPFGELRKRATEIGAVLIVVDTLFRFAETMIEDANSAAAWTPVMAGFTRLAQDTGAAVLLLHHASKNGGYRDSTAIGAGVDMILEMSEGESPAERKVTARGRWAVEPFTIRLDEDGYKLAGGSTAELSLDARVLLRAKACPGLSKRALAKEVGGKTVATLAEIARLLRTGALVEQEDGAAQRVYLAGQAPAPEAPRMDLDGGSESEGNAWGNAGETPRETVRETDNLTETAGTSGEDRFPATPHTPPSGGCG